MPKRTHGWVYMFQERTIVEDPVLGDQYKRYKIKVPYRLIPYIW